MREETKIIHGNGTDPLTGAVSTPIYQTSTFEQEEPGVNRGFDYARTGNPTREVLENTIASLESAEAGFAFGSGLAAVDAVLKLLKTGDEIIAVDDIYGGSFRLFEHIYSRFGIDVKYIDTTDITQVFDAISEKTKIIWLETPTNPTLKISDIEAIARIAEANDCLLVVDNTFASPALQKPLELGADIVIHSATKYLGGHSDVLAGLVAVATPELAEEIKFIQNASGGVLGPWDCWLVIRGIQTLHLRIEKQCKNAFAIAEFLNDHEVVDKVFYPGLASHTNHEIAKKQQRLYGGVVSFSLKDDTLEAAKKFVTSTKLFKLAESLGGVRSLTAHPATMTHKSTPTDIRRNAGIQDSLIRLSCGIEHELDLVEDVQQALNSVLISQQPETAT
jgi:cystathionine beta-lyase